MREIVLTQGQVALVDDVDYEHLAQYNWHAQKDNRTWYARRTTSSVGAKRKHITMHRQILEISDPGVLVDHKNRNGLDNRRQNLRICDRHQNQRNRIGQGATSIYKGVHWCSKYCCWVAQIRINSRLRTIGRFDDEADAARAYDIELLKIDQEFALTNF